MVIAFVCFCFAETGITGGSQPFLELRKEPRTPISSSNLFEVVADDLQKLNQNLLSVSSSELRILSFISLPWNIPYHLDLTTSDFNIT